MVVSAAFIDAKYDVSRDRRWRHNVGRRQTMIQSVYRQTVVRLAGEWLGSKILSLGLVFTRGERGRGEREGEVRETGGSEGDIDRQRDILWERERERESAYRYLYGSHLASRLGHREHRK